MGTIKTRTLRAFFSHLYLGAKFSFSYFSLLPMNVKKGDDLSKKEVLASMLLFLPFVGLTLGLVTLLFSFLAELEWYGAIISALVYMMLYGFIHTEAVMDVADAIYAAHSGKDPYVIIKEPTVGAMGVLYVIGFVLLKISGIIYLLTHELFMEFIAVLIVSRLSLLLLFKVHQFRSSFAVLLKNSLSNSYLLTASIVYSIIGSLLMPYFVILLIQGLFFALLISSFIKSKVGFVNGDVLGCTLESVEILLFLTVALFMV